MLVLVRASGLPINKSRGDEPVVVESGGGLLMELEPGAYVKAFLALGVVGAGRSESGWAFARCWS